MNYPQFREAVCSQKTARSLSEAFLHVSNAYWLGFKNQEHPTPSFTPFGLLFVVVQKRVEEKVSDDAEGFLIL